MLGGLTVRYVYVRNTTLGHINRSINIKDGCIMKHKNFIQLACSVHEQLLGLPLNIHVILFKLGKKL